MPTPQENALVVEQAGKPVLKNGAKCAMDKKQQADWYQRLDVV
ncbi:hypothetical protein QUA71_17695 [Microcoleus sp. MON1_C5]